MVDALFRLMPRLLSERRIAVDIRTIDFKIVRHAGERILRRGPVAELNDVAFAFRVRSKLQEQQTIVMRGRVGAQRRDERLAT